MTTRDLLLDAIATTVADYRAGELAAPTPAHVDRWIRQFSKQVQVPLLRELDHVLKTTYFTRDAVAEFLDGVVMTAELAGADPLGFWKAANFLDIQQSGESQRAMLAIFAERLNARHRISTDACGEVGGAFIYLDDVMFTGNHVGNDLAKWIENDAPAEAVVHIIVIAIHTSGGYLVGRRLKQAIASSGKKIKICYWRVATIENRRAYKRDSEVLWPVELPDDTDLEAYLAQPHKFPFEPRPPGGKLGPFSSEEGRQLLERELLLAGVKIRAGCANPKDVMRPLGFSPFGLGFGSMIVTFRNCPNNCPLALWWGDPNAAASSPLSKWYPLLARKTYSMEAGLDDFAC